MTRTLLFLFFLPALLIGQEDGPYFFKDYNYEDGIKSVKFYSADLELSFPMIDLRSSSFLTLSFDDVESDEARDFQYKLIHCNADWTPSDLSSFEYLDRFDEGDLTDYEFSFGTFNPYTHYELRLPNQDIQWTVSGNYLLVVYDEEEENPIITRRFVVIDNQIVIKPQLVVPANISNYKTHQEIDFTVFHQGVQIRNPRTRVKAAILQNGRWDNAVTALPPFFIPNDETMDFDYQNKVKFPAGREFRNLDLRSIKYPPEYVVGLERFDDGWYATLEKDLERGDLNKVYYRDVNGSFIIENADAPFRIGERTTSQSNADFDQRFQQLFNDITDEDKRIYHDMGGDYLNVLFSLDLPKLTDKEVYLFGELTNWQIRDEFKMTYNDKVSAYVSKQYLKQGFYNYYYTTVDKKSKLDFTSTEGNYHETENAYTILIYHRAFGQRYDAVIGGYSFYANR